MHGIWVCPAIATDPPPQPVELVDNMLAYTDPELGDDPNRPGSECPQYIVHYRVFKKSSSQDGILIQPIINDWLNKNHGNKEKMPRDLTSIAVKTENCNISICQILTSLFMGIKPLGHMIPHLWCPRVWKSIDALLTHQGFWIKTNPHRKKYNLYAIQKHTTGCKAQLVIPRSSQLNQLISQPTAYHSGLG